MQQRNEPLPGLLYEAQLPPPPESLSRQYNSMGRSGGNTVEIPNAIVAIHSSEENDHYIPHTDVGTERMFPRRAPHLDGNDREESTPAIKIPSVGAMGLGMVGIGMMAKGRGGKTQVASSLSNSGSYSDVELSDREIDHSGTSLRAARERDDSSPPVTSSRPMNRRGIDAATPPTRVAGDSNDSQPQGLQ